MSATSRDLTPAQTSAAMVLEARRVKTLLAECQHSARSPGARWDERACTLAHLELAAMNIASCLNYGSHAAANALGGVPGANPDWIQQTTYGAACLVSEGANALRPFRGAQRETARPLKLVRASHQVDQTLEVLYDLLVRKSGTYRLRPGDAPEFTELLAGICKELSQALCTHAKHSRPVLGDEIAEGLVFAGGKATRAWAALGPVHRSIRSAVAALPPRDRMRTKARVTA